MDFDPGELHDDSYDDGYADGEESNEPIEESQEDHVDFDEFGIPIAIATAAGFGYHMAQDEQAEQGQADTEFEQEPILIPLAQRRNKKGYVSPFGRWATKANRDPSKANDEIEYTKEEQLAIIKAEGE